MSVRMIQELPVGQTFLDRLRDSIRGQASDDPDAAKGPDNARATHTGEGLGSLSVRRSVNDFADVRSILDDLTEGLPQIVSFESTPVALVLRFVDMLAGAAYALGGQTTLVGEAVYLFTPATVRLEIVGVGRS